MSFIYFAWIASIGYAFVVIVGKLTSKYSLSNPWLFNFLYNVSLLLWITPFALANHAGLPTHLEFILPAGVLYGLSTLCFLLALYKLDVSLLTPLYNFRVAFSVILAALLIHEVLPFWKYGLITIIFLCGLFTTMDENFHLKSFFKKSIFIALIGMVFTSLAGIATNRALLYDNYWTVSLWIPIATVSFLLLTMPKFYEDLKKITFKPLGIMIVLGLFDTIGTLAANKAFSQNVGITSVILTLPISMFIAVVLSFFAPQLLEKHTVKVYAVRFVAAGAMIAAALLLSQ